MGWHGLVFSLYWPVHPHAKVVKAFAPGAEDKWPNIWEARTTIYAPYGNKLRSFMRAADADVRAGIHLAIGVASGAELQTRLETAKERLGVIGHRRGGTGYFNFIEAFNLPILTQ